MTILDSLLSLLDYECLYSTVTNAKRRITTHTLNTLTNKSITELNSRTNSLLKLRENQIAATISVGLLSVVAKTSEPLPSKWTSASVAIPAFSRCLTSRCLTNGHILHNINKIKSCFFP
jgi:hypothetical protein